MGRTQAIFNFSFLVPLFCNCGVILRKNYAKKGFFALGVGAGRPLHSTSEPIPLPGRPAPTPRAKDLFWRNFARLLTIRYFTQIRLTHYCNTRFKIHAQFRKSTRKNATQAANKIKIGRSASRRGQFPAARVSCFCT